MILNDFLATLAELLLIIALPIVIAAAVQHYRVQSAKLKEKLDENEKLAWVRQITTTAVKAAEQSGLIEQLTGPEKRKMAIDIVQRFLDEKSIDMDVANIASLVEAEVLEQFNNPTADTPQARQEMLQRAVKAAVKAAEESGLKGAIIDAGMEKKDYALALALRQLEAFGVQVDPGLVENLIDSEVMEQFTAPATQISAVDKQALIDKAVENAVLAAEQSGSQGLIENSGTIKKSYAMHLAREFLANHHIKINDTLLSGLIEAQLARMMTVAPG